MTERRYYGQLSARDDLPGHDAWQRLVLDGLRPKVFLDGREIPSAIAADVLAGTVTRLVRDDAGCIITVRENGKIDVARETLRGHVRIELVAR